MYVCVRVYGCFHVDLYTPMYVGMENRPSRAHPTGAQAQRAGGKAPKVSHQQKSTGRLCPRGYLKNKHATPERGENDRASGPGLGHPRNPPRYPHNPTGREGQAARGRNRRGAGGQAGGQPELYQTGRTMQGAGARARITADAWPGIYSRQLLTAAATHDSSAKKGTKRQWLRAWRSKWNARWS